MEHFRGDTFRFNFYATLEDGTNYVFQKGDIIKVGIKQKLANSKCFLYRKIVIEEPTSEIPITFTHEEMKRTCEGDKLLEVEWTDKYGNVATLYQEKLTIVGDVINE